MSEDTEWIRDTETSELERLVEEMRDELEDRRSLIFESPDETDTGEPASPAHVYVLSLVNPDAPDDDLCRVKVGIAKDPMRRLEQLQTGNPYRLVLETSVEALPSVARHVENWAHRRKAQSLVQFEWLRLDRSGIPSLIEEIRQESKRFADIAHARAKWSHRQSNGRERLAGDDERRLHKEARDVYLRLCPVMLQLRRTRARIALLAGLARWVPGIVEVSILPAGRRRFNAGLALEKFRDLAAPYTVERVQGQFRWRDVPTLGSDDWDDLSSEVERLEAQVRDLDDTLIAGGLQDEGERTGNLARLHAEFLELTQEAKRLEVDEEDVRARMIQRLEDSKAIAGVCSYDRVPKPKLDSKSFRKAHEPEAYQCCTELPAAVQRRIYQCRSYPTM